jgi:hypothetical protein
MRFFLFALLLTGCTTAEFAPASLAHQYPSRISVENIEIYRSVRPEKKFIEIGTATSCCSMDPNRVIDLLRKQASERGGDALMDFEFTASGQASATVVRYR